MEEERRKVYVEVDVTHRTDGTARPQRIKFENGERSEITVKPVKFSKEDTK